MATSTNLRRPGQVGELLNGTDRILGGVPPKKVLFGPRLEITMEMTGQEAITTTGGKDDNLMLEVGSDGREAPRQGSLRRWVVGEESDAPISSASLHPS